MHYVQKKLVLARLPGIYANSNENYRHYNFQLLLIFREISNPSSQYFAVHHVHYFRKLQYHGFIPFT